MDRDPESGQSGQILDHGPNVAYRLVVHQVCRKFEETGWLCAMTSVLNKWRRRHDPSQVFYVGDKYAVEEEAGN